MARTRSKPITLVRRFEPPSIIPTITRSTESGWVTGAQCAARATAGDAAYRQSGTESASPGEDGMTTSSCLVEA